MRIPLFLAAATLATLTALPLHAITLGCADYAPAGVDVKIAFEDVNYDTAHSMIDIRTLAESSARGSTQSESWPVGLSVGQFYMNVVKDIYKTRSSYDPATCGQIKAIHLEIGFAKNTIYVAKEFPKRSCPYKTVLGHEEKHKAVDRALLEEYADKAKAFFIKAAKTVGVVRNGSGAAIDGEISDDLSRAMDQLSGEIEDERTKRQKEVDSNDEYERVSASCDGDLMHIVNDRLALLEETNPGSTKPIEKSTGGKDKDKSTGSIATRARPSNIPGY